MVLWNLFKRYKDEPQDLSQYFFLYIKQVLTVRLPYFLLCLLTLLLFDCAFDYLILERSLEKWDRTEAKLQEVDLTDLAVNYHLKQKGFGEVWRWERVKPLTLQT